MLRCFITASSVKPYPLASACKWTWTNDSNITCAGTFVGEVAVEVMSYGNPHAVRVAAWHSDDFVRSFAEAAMEGCLGERETADDVFVGVECNRQEENNKCLATVG